MTLSEIKQKKQQGDIKTAAEYLGIKEQYAALILRRPNSKRHKSVLLVLERLIQVREIGLKG